MTGQGDRVGRKRRTAASLFLVALFWSLASLGQTADFNDVYATPEPGWGCLAASPTGEYAFTYRVEFYAHGFSPGQGVRILAFLSRPGQGDEGLEEICELANPDNGNHTCTGTITLGGSYLVGYTGQIDLYYKIQFYWSGSPAILDEADHTVYEICPEEPSLARSPTFVDVGEAGTTGVFEVWNAGGGSLSYAIETDRPWFSVSPSAGTSSGEHDPITVTVDRSGLLPDTYSGVATISPSVGLPMYVDIFMEVVGIGSPANVCASDGTYSDRIALSWDAVAGATSYRIYRADSLQGNYVLRASVTATSWADTGLSGGVEYWYKVKACDAQSCGSLSSAVGGWTSLPPSVPKAPTGVSASDGIYTDRIGVSWNASTGATSYKVYRAGSSEGIYSLHASPSGTSWTDAGLAEGVSYWYKVKACNAQGCSTYSEPDRGATSCLPVGRHLIIDTDPVLSSAPSGMELLLRTNDPDDVLAMLYAIRLLESHGYAGAALGSALSITTCHGNDSLAKSDEYAAWTVKQLGVDAHVKTYSGAATVFDPDAPVPLPDEQLRAVRHLLSIVDCNPGAVDIVVLGPLTNIALAMQADPDWADKVNRLYIVGGAVYSVGNVPKGTLLTLSWQALLQLVLPGASLTLQQYYGPEWNIYRDPVAAEFVIEGWPVKQPTSLRMVPIDVTRDLEATLTYFDYLRLAHSSGFRSLDDTTDNTPGQLLETLKLWTNSWTCGGSWPFNGCIETIPACLPAFHPWDTIGIGVALIGDPGSFTGYSYVEAQYDDCRLDVLTDGILAGNLVVSTGQSNIGVCTSISGSAFRADFLSRAISGVFDAHAAAEEALEMLMCNVCCHWLPGLAGAAAVVGGPILQTVDLEITAAHATMGFSVHGVAITATYTFASKSWSFSVDSIASIPVSWIWDFIETGLVSSRDAFENGLVTLSNVWEGISRGIVDEAWAIANGILDAGGSLLGGIWNWFLACPADILLADSLGRQVGNVGGVFINEIPGAAIDTEGDGIIVSLPAEVAQDVHTQIFGTGDGAFTLKVGTEGTFIEYIAVPTQGESEFQIEPLAASPDATMNIDFDGDGTFEEYRPPDLYRSAPPETPACFRVTSAGDVLADSTVCARTLQAGFADIAEWVSISEQVESGDVLTLDVDHPLSYCRTSTACSLGVAGVVSSEPGVTLGKACASEAKTLLALVGIVPVKVTNEGGPIQPGDLLVTSSTPGHAMRWASSEPCPCALVGKALEPMTDESGTILVLLTAH